MAPVMNGMCKLESLYDGSLELWQIAEANDAMMARNENEFRAREAAKVNRR